MKNKSTLTFYTFLFVFCFSLNINAQQVEKKKNNSFDLEIVTYSSKPDANLEHHHLLLLKNNSNKVANFKLSSKQTKCKIEFNNIIRSKTSSLEPDNDDDTIAKNSNKKKQSNLDIEIYNENLSKVIDEISLSPNESRKFYVKTIRRNNTNIGKWSCTKIVAKLIGNKQGKKRLRKSVVIESFIPDPNNKGN